MQNALTAQDVLLIFANHRFTTSDKYSGVIIIAGKFGLVQAFDPKIFKNTYYTKNVALIKAPHGLVKGSLE